MWVGVRWYLRQGGAIKGFKPEWKGFKLIFVFCKEHDSCRVPNGLKRRENVMETS